MGRIDYDFAKEHILYQFYSRVNLSPGPMELEACHKAFSDRLVDKLNEMAKKEQEKQE